MVNEKNKIFFFLFLVFRCFGVGMGADWGVVRFVERMS